MGHKDIKNYSHQYKKIKNINNVKQQRIFPVNCAADDLDLGFGESDQIELLTILPKTLMANLT